MSQVFLKCQAPTVKIVCTAVSPDATDKLTVTFNRYNTDKADEKLKAFAGVQVRDGVKPLLNPSLPENFVASGEFANKALLQTVNDLLDEFPDKEAIEAENSRREAVNKAFESAEDARVATILFAEIVDIDGLEDSQGNLVSYADASDEERMAIYNMLHKSNPYLRAIVAGYRESLINIGEARSKN